MNGMNNKIITEEKRIGEISKAIDDIESIYCKYGIKLIAKERKGKNIIVIQDTLNNDREYVVIK